MIELKNSGVDFNQDAHTYSLDGKILQGITGMLGRQLFPHKYDGISQSIMDNAAARGSMIHEQIELYDADIITEATNHELSSYIKIKADNNLLTLANEYLVTDREFFASAIDLVFTNGIGVILADIKTTYKLDKEYVRWQLSIYAYFFELQNPDLKVSELRAVWLRNEKYEYALLDRIHNDIIIALLDAEKNGTQFVNPYLPKSSSDYPIQVIQAERALADIEIEFKTLKENKDAIMSGLLELMKNNNIKSYSGQALTLSRKSASVREGVDSSLLKEKYPEIYEECKKISNIKESITLKLK